MERFLRDTSVEIVPPDAEATERAFNAWRRFGKGRHPAALNLGDCVGFAAAEQHGLPLLCVGDDFPATDLTVPRPGTE